MTYHERHSIANIDGKLLYKVCKNTSRAPNISATKRQEAELESWREPYCVYFSPAVVSNFFANASGLISLFTFAHSFPPRKLGSLEEHPMPKSIPLEEIRLMPWVEPPLELPGDFCKTNSFKSCANLWNDSFLFITGFSKL